jgi:NAD(P)-dependent dehydrogenase (short-subunit alcohol dehydrogenase family)
MGVEGEVAVVTGGEGPLGRAVTRKFLSMGAKIFIGWNNPEEWEEARRQIPSESMGQVGDMRVDLTKEDEAERLMQEAKNKFGSIDSLLHMVGMFFAGKRIWETDTAMMEKLLNVNLKSAFICSKHAIRIMLQKGKGRVLFFPPSLLLQPQQRFGAYAVSKSGLITLTESLREELKDTQITVNAVMFSVLDTPKTRKMPNPEPEKWVKPLEVADFLSTLCSDETALLSGSTLKLFGKL